MVIGILQIDLLITGSQSLKEKRIILKSLKKRLQNNFNISISELDHHEKWQRTSIGIACIGRERRLLDRMLSGIKDYIERENEVEIIDYSIELL